MIKSAAKVKAKSEMPNAKASINPQVEETKKADSPAMMHTAVRAKMTCLNVGRENMEE